MSKQTKECSRMQENNKAEHSGMNGNMRGSKEQTKENMGRRLSDTMLNRNRWDDRTVWLLAFAPRLPWKRYESIRETLKVPFPPASLLPFPGVVLQLPEHGCMRLLPDRQTDHRY